MWLVAVLTSLSLESAVNVSNILTCQLNVPKLPHSVRCMTNKYIDKIHINICKYTYTHTVMQLYMHTCTHTQACVLKVLAKGGKKEIKGL